MFSAGPTGSLSKQPKYFEFSGPNNTGYSTFGASIPIALAHTKNFLKMSCLFLVSLLKDSESADKSGL